MISLLVAIAVLTVLALVVATLPWYGVLLVLLIGLIAFIAVYRLLAAPDAPPMEGDD